MALTFRQKVLSLVAAALLAVTMLGTPLLVDSAHAGCETAGSTNCE